MKRDDRVYLIHILEAIDRIDKYTRDLEFRAFLASDLVQDGVIRQLEIMGEAAKNISSSTREITSGIPWKDIAGLRDVLIHQYFGVDLQAVWDTVKLDIPGLREEIKKLLLALPK